MGDDSAHSLGHHEVSDEEDADHLVPPVTPPGLAPDAGEWDFGNRLAAGVVSRTSSQGSGRHPQPTRHASLDAGYLQQRLYAAAHAVLQQPGSSGAPHEQGALGGVDKGSRGVHSAAPNDGIEIAWVWPPCLANDTGPVEFAVNVAPREWLNGKHSHRRVPCWPVSGLSLHITCGEQLLSVVELDICGTTKVRLQLPRTLTSPHFNFITVMLVDNGKVGPATQLLTMPSSAADEFSGLFRLLVEHEMLPQHSAAHPEYVSMLFGSSGCSSGSGTVRSYNSFLSLNGGSQGAGAAAAAAAAAAGAAAGRISPQRAAAAAAAAGTTPIGAGGPAPLPGLDGGFLQQQLLLQGQHRQHLRHRKHKARRHSAGYVQVSGSPAVVRQWCTGSAAAGRPSVESDAGARGAAASSNSSSRTRKAAAAAERAPRPQRASDGEACVHSAPILEAVSVEDSSGGTLTTIEGSVSTSNQVSNSRLHMLTPGPCEAEQRQVLCCAGAGAGQVQGAGQPQQQLHAQVHSELSSGRLSTLSSGDLPRLGAWEAAVAGDVHAAGLLLIGDGEDAEELHADQAAAAAAAARAAGASSTAGQAAAAGAQVTQQQQQQQHRGLAESDVQQQEGRKSLSLDRCAVHVHNEVGRAQLTRTRMSMDEGGRNRMSLDGGMRGGGSGGNLQLAAPDAAASGPAGAAAVNLAAIGSSALFFTATGYPGVAGSSTDPAVVAAAAAAAALTQQGPAPTVSVAAPLGSAGAAAAASTAVGADVANAAQAAAAPGPATAAIAEQAVPGALQQQSVPDAAEAAVPHMLVGGRGLERRTAAEANMSAAFTTAWTCHMLELASDLQYLVVCVPNAFASSLETWFGRIVDSRAGGSSTGSSTQQGAAAPAPGWSAAGLPGPGGSAASGDRRAESSWDSGMYMKRLGQVLDTLQEHKMWTTMSLLLQHCSSGGLDLYPAGCLHQFLQQQLTQQQQQPPPKQQQQQLQGPLDPGSLTPAYLANLGSLDVGSASYWVRPVPAMLNTQPPRMPPRVVGNGAALVPGRADGPQVSSTALSSSSKPGAAAGLQSVRAAYMQAAGARGRGAASIDLTPADLADARRAAAAAAADSRAGGRFPPTSSGSSSSAARCPLRQQQHEQRRAPRRSLSWPLGVLYSAFSWAQTAQLRHRQRSFWQRGWGLHPLIEGSERGSESSAASSIDASSYRSSSSTQRSSTVTSLDDMAPWARRVSSGLGRLAGGPAAAVAAAAAAAASGCRSSRGSQQRDAAARRVSERSSTANERNTTPARGSWTAGVDGRPDAAARSSTAAAAAMAVAGPAARSCDVASVQAADAAGARDSGSAAQRIAALQTSLLAQAALPPEKVEGLKAAAQARAKQQQQRQTGVKAQQPPADVQPLAAPAGTGASSVAACAVIGAAGSSRDAAEQLQEPGSSKPPARELDAAEAAVNQQQQRGTSAGPNSTAAGVAAEQEQGLATPDVAAAVAAVAAAAAVSDDVRTAAVGAGPAEAPVTAAVLGAEAVSSSALLGLTRQQRKAAASAAAAHAADHRASVVAAALTVVGVVELCASQLLTVFMVLYCLCFLPSIIPGLQPPHLVEAMSRRPAWMEGLLLLLLGLHWFAVTNVSIVHPSSQRPRTSMEAHRAAVAAVQTASLAAAASAEDAAAVQAARRRRREEHRLQRLRERQQRLLGRAMLSSVAAAVALGLLCYSLCVFATAWADHILGDGAGVLFLYRKWNEWQQRV